MPKNSGQEKKNRFWWQDVPAMRQRVAPGRIPEYRERYTRPKGDPNRTSQPPTTPAMPQTWNTRDEMEARGKGYAIKYGTPITPAIGGNKLPQGDPNRIAQPPTTPAMPQARMPPPPLRMTAPPQNATAQVSTQVETTPMSEQDRELWDIRRRYSDRLAEVKRGIVNPRVTVYDDYGNPMDRESLIQERHRIEGLGSDLIAATRPGMPRLTPEQMYQSQKRMRDLTIGELERQKGETETRAAQLLYPSGGDLYTDAMKRYRQWYPGRSFDDFKRDVGVQGAIEPTVRKTNETFDRLRGITGRLQSVREREIEPPSEGTYRAREERIAEAAVEPANRIRAQYESEQARRKQIERMKQNELDIAEAQQKAALEAVSGEGGGEEVPTGQPLSAYLNATPEEGETPQDAAERAAKDFVTTFSGRFASHSIRGNMEKPENQNQARIDIDQARNIVDSLEHPDTDPASAQFIAEQLLAKGDLLGSIKQTEEKREEARKNMMRYAEMGRLVPETGPGSSRGPLGRVLGQSPESRRKAAMEEARQWSALVNFYAYLTQQQRQMYERLVDIAGAEKPPRTVQQPTQAE